MVRKAIVRQTSNYKPAFSELQASFHERVEQRSDKASFGGELLRVWVILGDLTVKTFAEEAIFDGASRPLSGWRPYFLHAQSHVNGQLFP